MKLLPYIIPFVKDAAKAVKRICREEFKEVVDETLTELSTTRVALLPLTDI